MPRPQRYRDREAGAEDGAKDQTGSSAAPEKDTKAVDADDQNEQSSRRSGTISHEDAGSDVVENVARSMGWAPQAEWKRDPSKWQDAKAFLEDQPRRVESYRTRIRTMSQVSDRVIADEKRKLREEAEAEVRAAVAKGDGDGAIKASEKLAQAKEPLPETNAWMARNPWFVQDPYAQATARTAVVEAAKAGKSIAEQLEAAETVVRKRYPEHFSHERRETRTEERQDNDDREDERSHGESNQRGERRLSELRRDPPAVSEGQRQGASPGRRSDREKGWSDLPQQVRTDMNQFVRKFTRRGMKEAEAQRDLAREYWKDH